MDVRIEAAAMAANVVMIEAIVKVVRIIRSKVISLIERVASFSCPSIAGTSISAVSPDYNFIGGTA